MDYFEALILGLVQGLGEFLPISSSGHLIVVPWLLGYQDQGQAIDVALHFGTLLAVLIYFRKDWSDLIWGTFSIIKKSDHTEHNKQMGKLFLLIVIATVPAAIAGKLLDHWVENNLRIPLLVAVDMILLGALLLYADRKEGTKNLDLMNWQTALLIGLAQSCALIPGVSRSGATITMALLLGLSRTSAARFSFLLSAPITFGAVLLKSLKAPEALFSGPALFGIFVSFVSGYLSIKYLLKLVQTSSYRIFSFYRFAFGITVIIVTLFRTI